MFKYQLGNIIYKRAEGMVILSKSGKLRLGVTVVIILVVLLFVGVGSGVDLGLPVGSSAVQSWDGVAVFNLTRNSCSSPVSCEAEFSVLPSVNLSFSSGLVGLSADVVKGGVAGLEIFEKVCVDNPVYGSYDLCGPFNETRYDSVNQTFYVVNNANCTVAQGAQTGVRMSCSLNPLGSLVSFQSNKTKTYVVKGNVKPNTFADWKVDFAGYKPSWAFWNSSGWDCYVNLSAYEPSGVTRTYAFISKNFNPIQEWSTCAVPYNASVRLLEYLGNGSYSEITSQISNASVNGTGYMNSFNLNWQSNFTAFENKTYALYVDYQNDPLPTTGIYTNPWTLATTLNDDLIAYRVNGTDYGFIFDDDFQLVRVDDIKNGMVAMHGMPTTGNDVSMGVKTTNSAGVNTIAKNTNLDLDSNYVIMNDGAVFREFMVQAKGHNLSWKLYSKGQVADWSVSRQNATAVAESMSSYGTIAGDGAAWYTKVFWNETRVTDPAGYHRISQNHGYVGSYANGAEAYSATMAFNEGSLDSFTQGQNLTFYVFGGAGEFFSILTGSYGSITPSWNFEPFTIRLGFIKTDGSATIAKARASANLTYQDLVYPIIIGKLNDASLAVNTAPDITINLNPTSAYTNTWINVSGTYTDKENNIGTAYFNLTVNGTTKASETRYNVTNGSSTSWLVDPANWSKNNNLTFTITAYDGTSSTTTTLNTTVLNTPPTITNYNASSQNRTLTYNSTQNVNFTENETIRFAIETSDADNEALTISWWLNNAWQTFTTYFDKAFNFLSAGTYNVTAYINDTQNTTFNHWNVQVDNKVKETFTVDFENPTPNNNSNLPSNTINISFSISPYITETPQSAGFVHDTQAEFNGIFSSTEYNTTQQTLQLVYGTLNGTYASTVLDFGGNVSWKNLTWTENEPRAGQNTPQTNLVALWRMNEPGWNSSAGQIQDTSGSNNHGRLTTYAANTSATAMFNRSGSFLSNDYVQMADTGFPMGANSRTIEAWVKTTTDGGIFSYGNFPPPSSRYVGLGISGGKLFFDGGGPTLSGTSTITNNAWHHVAATYDGTTLKLYVDGQQEASTSMTLSTSTDAGQARIASYQSATPNQLTGQLDDVAVWNTTLNSTQITEHHSARISALNIEIRSCDDSACTGENYTAYTNGDYNALTLQNNRWLQYRATFGTNDQDYIPRLSSITIKGDTTTPTPTYTPGTAWIEFDGQNYTDLSGTGNHHSRTFNNLLVGTHTYTAHANNTYGDLNFTEQRTANVPSYNITFNVTSGENGASLNNVQITCNYTGFNQNGDTTNPYGPYAFPTGNWQCEFVRVFGDYFNKTQTFIADSNKTVNIVMSITGGLTGEEHNQLDWLYNCWRYGDCNAYSMLQGTYINVSKIWQQYLPTDNSVVTQETFISKTLSSTQNITISYTLNIPFKEGYNNGDLLPIRIFYWFTDGSKCYNQDKQADANNAVNPFCVPLVATYVGPNNGTVSFTVDLRPNLPAGTYNITRQIDIDPVENGQQIWKTYGREKISQITVLKDSANNMVKEAKENGHTVAKALDSGMGAITGAVTGITGSVLSINSLIAIAMICLTMITISYFKYTKSKL